MTSIVNIWGHANGIKKYFLFAILCVAIETSFEVIIPFLMADIIDVGIMKKDANIFLEKGFWMIVCAFFSLLFGILYAKFAGKAVSLFGYRLRKAQFEMIQTYTFTNLDHFDTSGLITRLTSDVAVIQNSITSGLRPFVRGPVMLILGLFMSFMISPEITLVFFFVLPILGMLLFLIVKKVAPMYSHLQKAMDALNAQIQENLLAIRAIKAFVRDEYEIKKFEQVNQNYASVSQKTFHYALFNLPAFQFTMYTVIVLLILVGVQMILANQMKVGELTGVLSYVLQIMNSLMMISNIFLLMTRSLASVQRIQEVFDENVNQKNGTCQDMKNGSIIFEDVSFRYNPGAQENVLEHINLSIESGQKIGILGATGSAKSSLVQLICRLYDVNEGCLYIGGHNIKEYDMTYLRQQVGIVLQSNVLFSGTILDNLRWGNPNASLKEVKEACQIACVDTTIDAFPDGYDTWITQGGTNVSGGQKQRICIARALLKHPKILIFDDSTSAVDTKTDAKIRQALQEIHDMTQIIVSQRISSIQHCDKILILDNGHFIESGSHETLLKTSSFYQELYASQRKGGDQ